MEKYFNMYVALDKIKENKSLPKESYSQPEFLVTFVDGKIHSDQVEFIKGPHEVTKILQYFQKYRNCVKKAA